MMFFMMFNAIFNTNVLKQSNQETFMTIISYATEFNASKYFLISTIML